MVNSTLGQKSPSGLGLKCKHTVTHCWNHSYAATPQTLPNPDSSYKGCLSGGVFHFSVALIMSEMNMFSWPFANGSEALSLSQVFGDLVMGMMVNDSVIYHHLLFSAFFTLCPVPCSFLSPPGGTTTRPVSKDDLCYHQHPSKCIYSPTGLPGRSATLPCLYGDTWLLTSTGARHEDNRKWRAVTF